MMTSKYLDKVIIKIKSTSMSCMKSMMNMLNRDFNNQSNPYLLKGTLCLDKFKNTSRLEHTEICSVKEDYKEYKNFG